MWVSVTQHDIRKGAVSLSTACPVTRAVRRALRKAYGWQREVSTGIGFIRVGAWGARGADLYPLPPKVRGFILAFDEGRHVTPLRFQLRRGG